MELKPTYGVEGVKSVAPDQDREIRFVNVPKAQRSPDLWFPDPSAILESIGEVVYDWDLVSDRIVWGPNAQKVLNVGELSQIASGSSYAELVVAGSPNSRAQIIHEALANPCNEASVGSFSYRLRYGVNTGHQHRSSTVWVEDTGRWFPDLSGKPARAHGLLRVIPDIFNTEDRIASQSRLDPLTGVLNRASLIEIVEGLLTRNSKRSFCILLAGIDNMFALNRTYGYDVADEVIAAMAKRLRSLLRANDHLARYAGNKFALVLDHCDQDQMAFASQRFAEESNSAPFETSAGLIPAALRLGGVCAPAHGLKASVLFQNLEEALDLARAAVSGQRFVAYNPSLVRKDTRLRAARVAENIVTALNDRRIEIAVQPVVLASNQQLAFGEALLRLRDTDGSLRAPGSILPVAEQTGMIHLLDQRVLEIAVETLRDHPRLSLSVNVSGATLRDPEWPQRMAALLTLDPHLAQRLIIEITETSAVGDMDATQQAIAFIRQFGARVAMDDFGAGHTSFRNLRAFDFDIIKMDGAFIQNLSRSSDDRFFVRTLIDLAQELGTPIVAEWVETQEAANLLTEWGVTYLQGDFFGPARQAKEFIKNLQAA